MTEQMVVYQQPADLDNIQRVAKMFLASGYFDRASSAEQGIAQLAVKIMAGQEFGLQPFAAAQGIHIIQGRPALSANIMAAAVKASRRYDYRVRKNSADVVSIEFFQLIDSKWESLGVSEFTAEDAKKAGTQNMVKFPRNMLFARAISNGVRWYCPDVFSGNAVYTPEEFDVEVDVDTGEITERPHQQQPTPVVVVEQPKQQPVTVATNGNGAPVAAARWKNSEEAFFWAYEAYGMTESNAKLLMKDAISKHGGPKQAQANMAAVFDTYAVLVADSISEIVIGEQSDDSAASIATPVDLPFGMNVPAAKAWAVQVGACQNDFEATNSMRKIIESIVGKDAPLPADRLPEALRAFHARQLEKLAERQVA